MTTHAHDDKYHPAIPRTMDGVVLDDPGDIVVKMERWFIDQKNKLKELVGRLEISSLGSERIYVYACLLKIVGTIWKALRNPYIVERMSEAEIHVAQQHIYNLVQPRNIPEHKDFDSPKEESILRDQRSTDARFMTEPLHQTKKYGHLHLLLEDLWLNFADVSKESHCIFSAVELAVGSIITGGVITSNDGQHPSSNERERQPAGHQAHAHESTGSHSYESTLGHQSHEPGHHVQNTSVPVPCLVVNTDLHRVSLLNLRIVAIRQFPSTSIEGVIKPSAAPQGSKGPSHRPNNNPPNYSDVNTQVMLASNTRAGSPRTRRFLLMVEGLTELAGFNGGFYRELMWSTTDFKWYGYKPGDRDEDFTESEDRLKRLGGPYLELPNIVVPREPPGHGNPQHGQR